jgi:hypothetical protein
VLQVLLFRDALFFGNCERFKARKKLLSRP